MVVDIMGVDTVALPQSSYDFSTVLKKLHIKLTSFWLELIGISMAAYCGEFKGGALTLS